MLRRRLPVCHRYLHPLVQPRQHPHQPINGEPAQLRPPDARVIRCCGASQFGGGPHRQATGIKHPDDLLCQGGLELFNLSIGMAEIGENVAAAAHQLISSLTEDPPAVYIVANVVVSDNAKAARPFLRN